jgi:hypothetical protein
VHRSSAPRAGLFFALILTLAPESATAQDPAQPVLPTLPPVAADVQEPLIVTPGKAFLRAILIPGWGHASIDEHTRGGFYFLTESAAAWMMVRTRVRLGAAKDARDLQVAQVHARLAAQGITDPVAILAAEDEDAAVTAARDLVESRSQQFEDWLVFGVFMVFLGGADAFVSAHLKDFPEPLRVRVGPSRDGIRFEGSVGLRPGPSR